MPTTDTIIESCYEQGRLFAMVIPPGGSWADARWYAPMPGAQQALTWRESRPRPGAQQMDFSESSFAVRPFCLEPDASLVWMNQVDPVSLLISGARTPLPPSQRLAPTPDEAYRAQARSIIDSLRTHGGKTVLSRVVTAISDRPVNEVIREYFDLFPDTMRYVYRCDDTGMWFGASPELLLEYDSNTQRLRTMSLAGTRKAAPKDTSLTPWDAKNLTEHQYVTDYILEGLRHHGLEPVITDSIPLRFGEIEHLCDRIEAIGDVDAVALADTLSPTPALCGYPKERAYQQIIDTELHPRLYYGGWVAIREGSRFLAHVNLRCARVSPTHVSTGSHCARRVSAKPLLYALYVGGGLTADSDVEAELAETRAKAKTLMNCITKHGEY